MTSLNQEQLQRLKKRRQKLRLTQDLLGRLLGVSHTYINFIEKGERRMPREMLAVLRDKELAAELLQTNERHKAELAEIRSTLGYRSRVKTS